MTILSSNNAEMCKVERVFHAVGQGGFYTEEFNNPKRMVIYDCGGNSADTMKEYLHSFIQKEKQSDITAVFISHFHCDHINGLQFILPKVKKLFLPQLTPNRIVETVLFNAINFSAIENVLANNTLSNIISADTNSQIIEVLEDDENRNKQNIDNKIFDIDTPNKEHYTKIPSGSQITAQTSQGTWVYIPYNLKQDEMDFEKEVLKVPEIRKLYEDLSNGSKNLSVFHKQLVKWASVKDEKELKRKYEAVFGKSVHNSQSMALFSGVLCHDFKLHIRTNLPYLNRICFNCVCGEIEIDISQLKHIPCNFLYTGDFESTQNSVKKLMTFYRQENHNVWATICGIQVPHHGSRHNYRAELYQNMCYAIVSAGAHNKFHHPNVDTLLHIFQQGCMPHIVTEDINSIIYQQFKFISQ